ncbi:hypothetical protein BDM02DRAFT_1548247 [Thelephora ganbajun]|uniref:Uncharacterized protein n=1 Tax=Thelephora ganbajun TaxID=370292 RepID=A0ACB6Z1C0_THEGA|nr:hypothetical protein BDM02DRAFT_1548247 [Thelephora ganbajun]
MENPTKNTMTVEQPRSSIEMNAMRPPVNNQQQETHEHGKAHRLRGGGAAKDCFLAIFGCFLCCGNVFPKIVRFAF